MASQQTDINMTIRDVNMTITFCDKDSYGVSMMWSTDDAINKIMDSEISTNNYFYNENGEVVETEGTTVRDLKWITHILPENWKKGQEVWIGKKVNTDYCCYFYYQPVGRGLPFLKIDIDGFIHIQRFNISPSGLETSYEKCNCKYNSGLCPPSGLGLLTESARIVCPPSPPIKKICHYVAQRGPKKGETCGSKFTREGLYCYKHKKFEKK